MSLHNLYGLHGTSHTYIDHRPPKSQWRTGDEFETDPLGIVSREPLTYLFPQSFDKDGKLKLDLKSPFFRCSDNLAKKLEKKQAKEHKNPPHKVAEKLVGKEFLKEDIGKRGRRKRRKRKKKTPPSSLNSIDETPEKRTFGAK